MTQGSKTPTIIFPRSGAPRAIAREAGGERWRAWRSQVTDAAIAAYGDFKSPIDGPVAARFRFDRMRPRSHFGAAGFVKASAPSYPSWGKDVLKMARAVEDSLSKVIYRDDSQIVTELISKRWADAPGVQIDIFTLNQASPPDLNPECLQLALTMP